MPGAVEDTLRADWHYPTAMRVGAGRLAELPECCRRLGMSAPLLVTDPGLAELPFVEAARESCEEAGLRCQVFSDLQPNPRGVDVEKGVAALREGSHDGVIALGGGSALDAGKAIALMAGQRRPLFDFVDEGDNWQRANPAGIMPVVAVPTTAGTGSEVGRASVITDEAARLKRIIFHPAMMPGTVILDPELCVSLPRHITAATGMDALSHNLEALCAPSFHPMAEGIALEGMRLVQQHLEKACSDGGDIEARTGMLIASSMGATAFQRGLGGMHALAHPLGARYGAHHGLLNAVLMPYVLAANMTAIEDILARAARYLDLPGHSAGSFMDWVLGLRERIEIPYQLSEADIHDGEAGLIGELAVQDPSAGGNPIPFDASEYTNIFVNAVHGRLG